MLTSVTWDGTLRVWDMSDEVLIVDIQSLNTTARTTFSRYGATLTIVSGVEDSTSLSGVQILVPVPSLDRLNAIAALCVRDGDTGIDGVQAVAETPDSLADLPAFIARIEALPADAIPPACAADLSAVAEALLAESE